MPEAYEDCLRRAREKGIENPYAYCSPVLKREQAKHPGMVWSEKRRRWVRAKRKRDIRRE
jgi:hypothetical protein